MDNKPDILIFLSDQHNAMFTGYENHDIVETPNLDRIVSEGTVFMNAYTSCPLCVPARSSFLTGQLASRTGIFTNSGEIPSAQSTFLHSLVAEGYETVLCGRMHFLGPDQRHGFTKRFVGDFTPTQRGCGEFIEELGDLRHSVSLRDCINEEKIGGGNSPVLEYDRAVIKAAQDYLKEDHDKPQCMVIGTYGPHFTYIAPPDLYKYYKNRVQLPASLTNELNYNHPILEERKKDISEETILKSRAAYFGMITNLDRQIGQVYDIWQEYLTRQNKEGVFAYLSDHGDQNGDRKIYAKQTFFEGSARIPLIFTGAGIKQKNIINSAASIMDIGPTLIDMIDGIIPPEQDGKSLLDQLQKGKEDKGRTVITEFVETPEGVITPGRMIKQDEWKLMSYNGLEEYDLLFNTAKDPDELHNLVEEKPEKKENLKELLAQEWDVSKIIKEYQANQKHYQLVDAAAKKMDVTEKERWHIPERVTHLPGN